MVSELKNNNAWWRVDGLKNFWEIHGCDHAPVALGGPRASAIEYWTATPADGALSWRRPKSLLAAFYTRVRPKATPDGCSVLLSAVYTYLAGACENISLFHLSAGGTYIVRSRGSSST